MGHLIACMINRADLLEEAVRREQDVLQTPPAGPHDGWGVGFYQAGEVLHKKHPQPSDEPLHWSSLLAGVQSNVAIAHVRDATVGARRADNNHPFRMRAWLFAHAGEIAGFAAMQSALLRSMPDFLRRNIRGETDSEHVFHVFLSFLHEAGQLDAADVTDHAVATAVRGTVAQLDQLARDVGAPPSDLNMVLTNGRQLFALRRGASNMVYVERSRLSLPDPNRDKPTHPADPVRYVLIANTSTAIADDYRVIEDGRLLAVDRDLHVTSHAL